MKKYARLLLLCLLTSLLGGCFMQDSDDFLAAPKQPTEYLALQEQLADIHDMERLRPDGAQAFQDTVEQNPSMPILILHGEGRTWLSRLKSTVCFQRDARIQDVISVAASLLR